MNSAAYVVSMLIWLGYSLVAEYRAQRRQDNPRRPSQKWDYALDEARNATPADSLLDTMDKTVERLLYHRGSEASVTVTNRH